MATLEKAAEDFAAAIEGLEKRLQSLQADRPHDTKMAIPTQTLEQATASTREASEALDQIILDLRTLTEKFK